MVGLNGGKSAAAVTVDSSGRPISLQKGQSSNLPSLFAHLPPLHSLSPSSVRHTPTRQLCYPTAPLLFSHARFYATTLSLSNPLSPSLAHPLAMLHWFSNWAVQRRLEAATGPEERHKIVACMCGRIVDLPTATGTASSRRLSTARGGDLLPECVGDASEVPRGKRAALACHETRSVVVQNAFETLEESAKDGIVNKLLGQGAAVFGEGARAWGTLGHATVAYVAQNYLTPTAAAWAKTVLNDTSTSYLANIASWADTYRATTAGAWSAPLHFVDAEDNPPTSCSVDYIRDCGASGCSISAIANYTQRAGDGRLGDVTQPLHDEALALGGNNIKVTYQGFADNLHADWDTYMPQTLIGGSTLADARSWATADIDSGAYSSAKASWIAGDAGACCEGAPPRLGRRFRAGRTRVRPRAAPDEQGRARARRGWVWVWMWA
ncbi:phospholipase C/P1 nuclease domain-containing protein [Mycena leptocephala]|nr:phospholipase C/P1 nuclease domain-containing protein [Mycena leptocephala]